MFLTILLFNSPPTRLLVLCHSFGTFFVRVCNVDPLFFRVYRYGFIGVQNMAAASIRLQARLTARQSHSYQSVCIADQF